MKIIEEFGEERVRGVEVPTFEEVGKAIGSAETILAAGAAGTQLLRLALLEEHGKKCKTIADINAIPPLGVEGLDSNDEGKEIVPDTFGTGVLAIGKLKNKTEVALVTRAAEESRGVFDYETAYEIAKRAVVEKLKEKISAESEPQKHWLP